MREEGGGRREEGGGGEGGREEAWRQGSRDAGQGRRAERVQAVLAWQGGGVIASSSGITWDVHEEWKGRGVQSNCKQDNVWKKGGEVQQE